MTFDEWIKSEGLSWDEAAALIGAANGTVARRYALGRVPQSKDVMVRIYVVSSGRVTPNDFYDLPAMEAAE